MSENTNSTTESSVANVEEATDAVADLLTGGIEEETTEDQTDEQTSESTDDNEEDESNEEEAEQETEEEDPTEEQRQAEDTTWAGVLGVEDKNIVLDDKGDFSGVNVKVDGETSTVDMNTLIAGFQTSKHNTNKSKALADDKREFEANKEQVIQDYTKKLNEVKKVTEFAHNKLMGEFNGVNWETLRATDPAEYAASMTDYKNRDAELRQLYSNIESEQTAEIQQAGNKQSELNQIAIQGEVEKMLENNPTWGDKDIAAKAMGEMSDFVIKEYGFTEHQFNSVTDSRTMQIIQDAMKYRQGKAITAKKMSKPVPKFSQAKGTSTKKKVSKLDKLTKAAKSSSGANKRTAQVDAISELLGGG